MSDDGPECPHCGSHHAERISATAIPDDTYDPAASGIYRCQHCREAYQYLKLLKVQTFSPKAQCPRCASFRTKTVSVHPVMRYHLCLEPACRHSFKTVRPSTERASRAVSSSAD